LTVPRMGISSATSSSSAPSSGNNNYSEYNNNNASMSGAVSQQLSDGILQYQVCRLM
jgi:hypothetical protein